MHANWAIIFDKIVPVLPIVFPSNNSISKLAMATLRDLSIMCHGADEAVETDNWWAEMNWFTLKLHSV